jgi:hypothetical protein
MVSDVLLLSYLDKISLSLTGEAGQASACLYSEVRLYKGARMAPLSHSTTTRCSARDWERSGLLEENPQSGCSDICASLKGPLN